MASFRIHQDQENRGNVQFRQKVNNMAPPQGKRTVFGVIDSKLNTQNLAKPKALEVIHKNNDTKNGKVLVAKPPIPAVPVAQFEAFKVYEDVKENLQDVKPKVEIEQEKVANPPLEEENVPSVSNEKSESPVKNKTEPLVESSEDIIPASPDLSMSIEKSFSKAYIKDSDNDISLVEGVKSEKDRIFEIEEYRPDIYLYLRDHEVRNRPKSGYMRKQPDITYNMRTILVDWLVEVAQEFKLQAETLYLCINYIDRFLSYMSVVRGKLQLVGTTAMFIAAKYEEIYPPEIGEFVYITDDTYTKKQLLRMEQLILKVLSFDLSIPTPLTFITAICMSTNMPPQVMNLSMYMCELAMLEADSYIEILPSELASAAIAVARFVLKLKPWTDDLMTTTRYDEAELKKSMEFLYLSLCKAPTLQQQAIQEKYNSSKYMYVSQLSPQFDNKVRL